jgi:hypothetical protein
MGLEGLTEELEDVFTLEPAGLDRGEQAFHEPAPARALAAEAVFSPQHRRSQHSFGVVVGRLNPVDAGEGPKRFLHLEQPAAEVGRRLMRAAQSPSEHLGQSFAPRFKLTLKFSPRQFAVAKVTPQAKDLAADPKPVIAQHLRLA